MKYKTLDQELEKLPPLHSEVLKELEGEIFLLAQRYPLSIDFYDAVNDYKAYTFAYFDLGYDVNEQLKNIELFDDFEKIMVDSDSYIRGISFRKDYSSFK